MKIPVAFLTILMLAGATAQNVNLNCVYFLQNNDEYTCLLQNITVIDNESQIFSIGGLHLPGRTNDNVVRVTITNSNIPFIVTQLFRSFRNLLIFETYDDSALSRIQPGAFTAATSLMRITIFGSPELKEILPYAFFGPTRLKVLELSFNGLQSIYENSFDGMTELEDISLQNNQIRQLPVNLLRSASRLQAFLFSNNLIESLHGSLFANNPNITIVNFSDNQINSIGHNFLDYFITLRWFSFQRNHCADGNWIFLDGHVDLEQVRQGLRQCFENSVEAPDDKLKTFILELQGTLILKDENGTEVLRI